MTHYAMSRATYCRLTDLTNISIILNKILFLEFSELRTIIYHLSSYYLPFLFHQLTYLQSNKIKLHLRIYQPSCNKEIIPEVKLVPEAQPRDTNGRVVLLPLSTLGRKYILMARSIAEGPNF